MRCTRIAIMVGFALLMMAPILSATDHSAMNGTEAVAMLKDGNQRFVNGQSEFPNLDPARMEETSAGQHPFAAVLTCSDSRVPVEQLFDVGVGDLFVVRVAGNVAGNDQIATIEYGVEHLHCPVLLVMGHTNCGAVTAAVEGSEANGAMASLMAHINPSVQQTRETFPTLSGKKLVSAVIKTNVWQTIQDMLAQSQTIRGLVSQGKLTVQGAIYHIGDGTIEWLGKHPQQAKILAEPMATVIPEPTVQPKSEEPAPQTMAMPAAAPTPAAPVATVAQAAPTAEQTNLEKAMAQLEAAMTKMNQTDPAKATPPAPAATEKPAPPAAPADQSLQQQLSQLRTELTALSKRVDQRRANDSALTALATELALLKAELAAVEGQNQQNSQKLASLDGSGYAPMPNSADQEKLASLVTSLTQTIEKAKTPAAPAQNSPAVKHGAITMTGVLHQQYYSKFGAQEKSSFESNKARIGVSGVLNSYAKVGILGEFAKSPKLLDGFLSLSPNKYWTVKFGQFWPSFYTDYTKSAISLPFINYSLASTLATSRDIGASVLYANRLSKKTAFSLYTGLFNGSGINVSDANNDKNWVARGELTYADMFTVAPAYYTGKTNDTGVSRQKINNVSTSVSWNYKAETVEAEYIHSKVGSTKKSGWYLWGGHTFTTHAKFLPEIQLLARYDQYDPNLNAPDDRMDRVTLGTNLFIDKRFTMVQLNYQFNGEQGTSVSNDELLVNFQVCF